LGREIFRAQSQSPAAFQYLIDLPKDIQFLQFDFAFEIGDASILQLLLDDLSLWAVTSDSFEPLEFETAIVPLDWLGEFSGMLRWELNTLDGGAAATRILNVFLGIEAETQVSTVDAPPSLPALGFGAILFLFARKFSAIRQLSKIKTQGIQRQLLWMLISCRQKSCWSRRSLS